MLNVNRSEWDEFWRTASTTESYYNPSTTTANPYTTTYSYYDKSVTTENLNKDLSSKTYSSPKLKTTKNPYNFADFGKTKYTAPPYFKTTKTFQKYTSHKSQFSYTSYTSTLPTIYTSPYQPNTYTTSGKSQWCQLNTESKKSLHVMECSSNLMRHYFQLLQKLFFVTLTLFIDKTHRD